MRGKEMGGGSMRLDKTGGWGGRDRTSEWRNQTQLDYSMISKRIWKKHPQPTPAISIVWQPFPNEKQPFKEDPSRPELKNLGLDEKIKSLIVGRRVSARGWGAEATTVNPIWKFDLISSRY
jgi:hypothetical protein